MSSGACVPYGVGSPYVESVLEALVRLGWSPAGGVANIETDYRPARLDPIVGPDEIPAFWLELPVVLPLVTPGHRWSLEREVFELGFRSFAVVVDPAATVASTATIAAGAIVLGAAVGPGSTIGRLACLNTGAVLTTMSRSRTTRRSARAASSAETSLSDAVPSSGREPWATPRSRSARTRSSARARSFATTCPSGHWWPGTPPW